jgi:hypothetical protein
MDEEIAWLGWIIDTQKRFCTFELENEYNIYTQLRSTAFEYETSGTRKGTRRIEISGYPISYVHRQAKFDREKSGGEF